MVNTVDKKYSKTFSIRMPENNLEFIRNFAQQKRWSVNQAINYLAEIGINEESQDRENSEKFKKELTNASNSNE